MKYVYMVQLDWSTTDTDGIESELFIKYGDAYARFKERISDELNPEKSWVGEEAFGKNGKANDGYVFDEYGDAARKTDLSWHISDKYDYYRHSFIDLKKLEVK